MDFLSLPHNLEITEIPVSGLMIFVPLTGPSLLTLLFTSPPQSEPGLEEVVGQCGQPAGQAGLVGWGGGGGGGGGVWCGVGCC